MIAEELVAAIPSGVPGMFNPWKESCSHDTKTSGPEARFERLVRHLDCNACLILAGEAPGLHASLYNQNNNSKF